MGKLMRRISERFKERTGGAKGFATSNQRNTAMLRELATYSAQLKVFEKDIRALKTAAEAALKTARDSLASPLPRLHETHEATLVSGRIPLQAGHVGGGGVKVEEMSALSIDAGKRLGDDVFTPIGRWQSSYTYVQQVNKELENLRLEVDSRKRTVDDLTEKVDSLRTKISGRDAGSSKVQEQLEAALLKLQHKTGKLTVAQERFMQQEADLFQRLSSMVHDAIWLRNYACAALCIEGDMLCAAGQAVGLIDPAAVPPSLHPAAGGRRLLLTAVPEGATIDEEYEELPAAALPRRALRELEGPPPAREALRLEAGPGERVLSHGIPAAALASGPGSARSISAPPAAAVAGPVVSYRGPTRGVGAGPGVALAAGAAAGAAGGARNGPATGDAGAEAAGAGATSLASSRASASATRAGGAWAPFRTVEEVEEEEEGEQQHGPSWHRQQPQQPQRAAARGLHSEQEAQWGASAAVQQQRHFADEDGEEYHSRSGTVIIHDISHLPSPPRHEILPSPPRHEILPSPPRHEILPSPPPRHRYHSEQSTLVGRSLVLEEGEELEEPGQQQRAPEYDNDADDVAYAGNPFVVERATDYPCFAPTTPSPNALPTPKVLQPGGSAQGSRHTQGGRYFEPIIE